MEGPGKENINIRTGLGAVIEMSFTFTIYWWSIQNYRDSIFMSNMQQETKVQICHQFPYLHILIFSVIGCVQMCSLSPRMRVVKGLVRYIALMVNRLCRCRCSYLVSSSVMLRGKSCCTVGWCGRCAEEQVIGGSCNVSAMSVARPWAQLTNTVCIVFK